MTVIQANPGFELLACFYDEGDVISTAIVAWRIGDIDELPIPITIDDIPVGKLGERVVLRPDGMVEEWCCTKEEWVASVVRRGKIPGARLAQI